MSQKKQQIQYAVISPTFGGFGVSKKAMEYMKVTSSDFYKMSRTDERLIDAVKTLKEEASGQYAKLIVVPLKPKTTYIVSEYDGSEEISEDHKLFNAETNKWALASKGSHGRVIREVFKTK